LKEGGGEGGEGGGRGEEDEEAAGAAPEKTDGEEDEFLKDRTKGEGGLKTLGQVREEGGRG